MPRCKACGSEIGGGNSDKCCVTKSAHQLDRQSDDRERASLEGRGFEEPSVNWKSGPHS
jgi:hypothetical protein